MHKWAITKKDNLVGKPENNRQKQNKTTHSDYDWQDFAHEKQKLQGINNQTNHRTGEHNRLMRGLQWRQDKN